MLTDTRFWMGAIAALIAMYLWKMYKAKGAKSS